MGGKALLRYGIETVRLPTAAMEPLGRAAAKAVDGRLVPWIAEKADHGDADIVVASSKVGQFGDEALCHAVGAATNYPSFHKRPDVRDPVMAIALDTPDGWFQVDIITAADRLVDFSWRFLSWGDFGTLAGQVARQMGLLLGSEGLRLPVRVPNAPRSHVLLTDNFDDALLFLGFDPLPHRSGFESEAAMISYVASSRYFDPAIFQSERMSSDSRRRARRRPTRPRISKAITELSANYVWPAKREPSEQAPFIEAALSRFAAHESYAELKAKLTQMTVRPATAFSGDVVSQISGVEPIHVMHLVNIIRHSFPNQEAFQIWKASATFTEVEERVLASLDAFNKAFENGAFQRC